MKILLKNIQVIATFLIIWIILTESILPLNLALGFGIALFTLKATNLLMKIDYADVFYLPLFEFIKYILITIKDIYVAAIDMSIRIIKGKFKPTYFVYNSKLKDQLALVLLANTITIIPGSVSTERNNQDITVLWADDDIEEAKKAISKSEDIIENVERSR
jgi:multisubunit Na+/H+ antiporter MnhE subunit